MKKTRLVFLAVMMLIGSIALAQVKSFVKEYDVEGPLVFTELGHIDPPYEVDVVVEHHGLISFTNIYINGVHVNNDHIRKAQMLSAVQRNVYDVYRLEARDLEEQLKRERVTHEDIVRALENYYRGLDVVTEVLVEGKEVKVVFNDSTTNNHRIGPWTSSAEEAAQTLKESIEFILERQYSLFFTATGLRAQAHPRYRQVFLEELSLARNGDDNETRDWRFLRPRMIDAIREAKERKR